MDTEYCIEMNEVDWVGGLTFVYRRSGNLIDRSIKKSLRHIYSKNINLISLTLYGSSACTINWTRIIGPISICISHESFFRIQGIIGPISTRTPHGSSFRIHSGLDKNSRFNFDMYITRVFLPHPQWIGQEFSVQFRHAYHMGLPSAFIVDWTRILSPISTCISHRSSFRIHSRLDKNYWSNFDMYIIWAFLPYPQ